MSKPHLFIATPTSGGSVLTAYATSLVFMVARLEREGIRTEYANIDGANISEQRDALVAMFATSNCTHILFIDADMQFAPDTASKLLEPALPFVGALSVRRKINLGKVAHRDGAPPDALAYDFVIHGKRIERRGNLVSLDGIGFGCVLIARDCIKRMAEKFGSGSYTSRYTGGPVAPLFRPIELPSRNRLSEDYSFCERWRECGGKVTVRADIDIKHVGGFAYGVPFDTYLDARPAPRSATTITVRRRPQSHS